MKNSEQKISDSFSHHYILWQVCKNYATATDSVCTWLLTFHFSQSPSYHHHLPSYPFCLLQLWTVNYKYCYNHSAESQDMHHQLLLQNNKHKPWKSADYTSYLQWTPSPVIITYWTGKERNYGNAGKVHKAGMAGNNKHKLPTMDTFPVIITYWTGKERNDGNAGKVYKAEMAHHTNGELILSFQDVSADMLITWFTLYSHTSLGNRQ